MVTGTGASENDEAEDLLQDTEYEEDERAAAHRERYNQQRGEIDRIVGNIGSFSKRKKNHNGNKSLTRCGSFLLRNIERNR